MKEYIDREAFAENVRLMYCKDCTTSYNGVRCRACWVDDMLVEVEEAPTADVVEVRHGECLICSGKNDIKQDCDNGYYVEVDREQCEMSVWLDDECLAVFSIDYCPNCGAKMDGKGEGE